MIPTQGTCPVGSLPLADIHHISSFLLQSGDINSFPNEVIAWYEVGLILADRTGICVAFTVVEGERGMDKSKEDHEEEMKPGHGSSESVPYS